jgi:hypothetical protein
MYHAESDCVWVGSLGPASPPKERKSHFPLTLEKGVKVCQAYAGEFGESRVMSGGDDAANEDIKGI